MPSIQDSGQPAFQIGELAKRTALSIDAIRFYERRRLLPPASRSAGRFRLYTADDIERRNLCGECRVWVFRSKKSKS